MPIGAPDLQRRIDTTLSSIEGGYSFVDTAPMKEILIIRTCSEPFRQLLTACSPRSEHLCHRSWKKSTMSGTTRRAGEPEGPRRVQAPAGRGAPTQNK